MQVPETFYMDRLVKVGEVHNDYSNVIPYNMELLMREDGSIVQELMTYKKWYEDWDLGLSLSFFPHKFPKFLFAS